MDKIFSKNLKFLRNYYHLSQEFLAIEIGLNRGNIASYEKGTAEPNMSNLLKIVKYFNINLADLMEKNLELSSRIEVPVPKSLPQQNLINQEGTWEMKHEPDQSVWSINKSQEMQKIIDGFRQFYLYRKAKGNTFLDTNKLMSYYEDLLEIADSLRMINDKLTKKLET